MHTCVFIIKYSTTVFQIEAKSVKNVIRFEDLHEVVENSAVQRTVLRLEK